MSTEEQNQSSGEVKVQAEQGSSQAESSDVVNRKAYEEVTRDMLKYKSERKDLQARLNELETKIKVTEEEKLKEQEEYKSLFEKRNQEYEELQHSVAQEKNRYLKSVKMNALKNELGGKIKDAYLVHADVDSIEFNDDGSLNPESVVAVANKFREDHSALIPSNNNATITNQAPSGNMEAPKVELGDLTTEQKLALLKNRK